MAIEKHGYQQGEDKELVKKASQSGVCPKCGSSVRGHPPVCPKCGSKPFEDRKKSKP